MASFKVTAQNWDNGKRIADYVFIATAATEEELRKRMRCCGTRVVSIDLEIQSHESGLSGCGVHSFYVD